MKTTIATYTFNAAAKTLDFSSTPNFDIKRLYAVINTRTQDIIYALGNPLTGYSVLASGVLTLAFNTTAMANSDPLIVIYEQPQLGSGALSLVPAGSVNGTPITTLPQTGVVRFLFLPNEGVNFTVAPAQPTDAPAITYSAGGSGFANNPTGPNFDVPLSLGQQVYIISITGSPKFILL